MADLPTIDWKNSKVLVTGGTGFIGSHLVKRLLNLGADVALLVLDEETQIPSHPRLEIFRVNIQDAPDVDRAVGRFQPNHVFHLAAQPLVGTAVISVNDTLDTNIRGAINLLQACNVLAKSLKSIVFISTDKVYGSFHGSVDEHAPLLGIGNPYDTSKVCADYIAQMFAKVYNLPIAIVRSGNIYGEGDKNWDRLIPGTFRNLINGNAPTLRSDGKMTRDYIYVDDIIDAYILLANKLVSGEVSYGSAINFGSVVSYSVLEVVHEMLGVAGRIDLTPIILNTAKHEIPHQHLSWHWAKKLGWMPKTPLEVGLQKSYQFYKVLLKDETRFD